MRTTINFYLVSLPTNFSILFVHFLLIMCCYDIIVWNMLFVIYFHFICLWNMIFNDYVVRTYILDDIFRRIFLDGIFWMMYLDDTFRMIVWNIIPEYSQNRNFRDSRALTDWLIRTLAEMLPNSCTFGMIYVLDDTFWRTLSEWHVLDNIFELYIFSKCLHFSLENIFQWICSIFIYGSTFYLYLHVKSLSSGQLVCGRPLVHTMVSAA